MVHQAKSISTSPNCPMADHTFADDQYVGYRIGNEVNRHKALGLGIYSNFRDHDIRVFTAVAHPQIHGIEMRNICRVKLDHMRSINTVVNAMGPGPTSDSERGHPYRCSNEICSEANN